ncbi:hypothetical protein [Sedimentibacter sp. MB31-C6]|uniref:hypothetical protein n=1 Tax=Sedimentibacter sp. MB31-C6 TaxID=3109366 RepID=UPI002DDD7D2B|nr:hypothetical protein [Sedimentibacter sp. MB36-C1]WSI05399.1 hypothetical protein U8307_06310 [Sedimentibacter sp. MB36-C1]
MLFTNLNIESKKLKIMSLIITLIGIIFILASKYIGSFSIRLAMISILIFSLMNLKMSYQYSTTKEKINQSIIILAAFLGLIKPELIMLVIGIGLLILTVPVNYEAIKTKDYSDVLKLIISGIGTLFALYCIINSQAALNTVIIILGIAFIILGCLTFYETLDIKKDKKPQDSDNTSEFGFTQEEQ